VDQIVDQEASNAKKLRKSLLPSRILRGHPVRQRIAPGDVRTQHCPWKNSELSAAAAVAHLAALPWRRIVAFIVAPHQVAAAAKRGRPRVHKVTVAIDCGAIINPDAVAAQMQGSVVWGLSSTLHEAKTLKGGAAEQRNFDRYKVAQIAEAPVVETHIIRSGQPLGGVGEPGVPPLAPAVCNAIFALTGVRVRRLPLDGQRLTAS
jgi:CO/xanthine dehydrogenase Mo-binding subunit